MSNQTLSEKRVAVRRILEGVYNDSDSHRLIEVLFGNIQTQDRELVENFKTEVALLTGVDSHCYNEICMLMGKLLGDMLYE
jgi:hypothetical protein